MMLICNVIMDQPLFQLEKEKMDQLDSYSIITYLLSITSDCIKNIFYLL